MIELMLSIKKFLSVWMRAWRKSVVFSIVLLVVSIISSNWVLYDHTPYDGPKGIGFPFAFYVGGGGLSYDPVTGQIGVPPYTFEFKIFVIDLLIWIAISLALSLSIIWVYNNARRGFFSKNSTLL